MNKLIEYFAKQHTFVNILTTFVLVIGVISAFTIKREVFPNIQFDVINITTIYPNASAESVESLITTPLESDLLEVDGVKEMTSTSSEGKSVINLQLDPDQVSIDEAEADIQDIVDAFKDMPEGAEDPLVIAINTNTSPLIEIALASNDDIDETELRYFAKKLKRNIEQVDGVASVKYKGLPDYELRVSVDPKKLEYFKISLKEIINAVKMANINSPGGSIILYDNGKEREFSIRTLSEFENEDILKELVLKSNIAEDFIKLKDVADIKLQFAEEDIYYQTNGHRGINLMLSKKDSADAINMVNDVKLAVRNFKQQYAPNLIVEYINDKSEMVKTRVSVLSRNLVIGLCLVLFILSIVLPFKMALIASIGIPFSFLGALIIFDYSDISLNLISMMGLIIVLGMLVDDAIVVTENAQRKIDEGYDPTDAAIKGTQEIWKPVTTSVTTTLAAFLPLVFMTGIFGKFLSNLPIGVIMALIISLFECFFILPSHVSNFIRKSKVNPKAAHVRFTNFWNKKILPKYSYLVRKIIRLRYFVALGGFIFLVFSFYSAGKFMSFRLFPGTEDNNFQIKFETEKGTTLEKTTQIASLIEKKVKFLGKGDVESTLSTIGIHTSRDDNNAEDIIGSNYAQSIFYIKSGSYIAKNLTSFIKKSKAEIDSIPEITNTTFSRGRRGPPVGKAVNIQVISEDYNLILKAVEDVKKELEQIQGVVDVSDSFWEGKEELIVNIDDQKLSLAGISRTDVANSIRATFDGIVVDKIQNIDEEIDIRITLPKNQQNNLFAVENIKIPNQSGNLIRVRNIASITNDKNSGSYQHLDSLRLLKVQAEIDPRVTNSARVNQIMKSKIVDLSKKYQNVAFKFGGEEKDRNESFKNLGNTFIIALFGIVLLLMLQFGNLYQPLIIALMIPFTLSAVIWAFFLHNMPLSFLAIIGMIALSGVIINNSIMFIDFSNKEQEKGKTINQSILIAAKKRLRPIFLTTITTVAGIMPTAYGIGGKDDFVVPIALALGWGMLIGSIITLIMLPSFIKIVNDIISKIREIKTAPIFVFKTKFRKNG